MVAVAGKIIGGYIGSVHFLSKAEALLVGLGGMTPRGGRSPSSSPRWPSWGGNHRKCPLLRGDGDGDCHNHHHPPSVDEAGGICMGTDQGSGITLKRKTCKKTAQK
ncbi:hypothetical protein [Methanogenium cariaci]|uniref:hypothetical protein n=1 Tax=Methanogenium cariaci TaxID=2197 RepID=UPI0012F698A7|nr:hypothetical protein [Methanogenium cariaci]